MIPRLLQPPRLDHLMIKPVALQQVVLALMVQLALAPKSLVLVLLPRQFQALLLQFQ